MNKQDADYLIKKLNLQPHPEGGHFARVYEAELTINQSALPSKFQGSRSAATHIYYLLKQNDYSAFHRIQSDELWHFYAGDSMIIYEIDLDGNLTEHFLGNDREKIELFFCVIKAGNWFAAKLMEGSQFALVGCTVSPGFDFAEFELGERDVLINQFPQHREIINLFSK